MKLRTIVTLLLCVFLIGCLTFQVSADEELIASGRSDPSGYWEITKDGTLSISGSTGSYEYADEYPWVPYAEYIEHIVVEKGTMSIGDFAFALCYNAKTVSMGKYLGEIGVGAFAGCLSLEKIEVVFNYPISKYFTDSQGALYTYSGKRLIAAPRAITSFTVPSMVTEIDPYAFSYASLQQIDLSNSVANIGIYAFAANTQLQQIKIPYSTKTIGSCAFSDCTALTNISIPNSITRLESGTFSGCSSLETVTIPLSMTYIGIGSFNECSALKDVRYPGTRAQWNNIQIKSENSKLINANKIFNVQDQAQYNGLCCVDGVWGLYKDGVLQTDFNDFVVFEGKYYYLENGIITWNYTGARRSGDRILFVKDSTVDWKYEGLADLDGVMYYFQEGMDFQGYSGLCCYYATGEWYYLLKGVMQTDYTGLVSYRTEGYFYVENGKVNWEYTGFAKTSGDSWYYVTNGRAGWQGYDGVMEYEGQLVYVHGGKISPYTCLACNKLTGEWYYVEKGVVTGEYTGLVPYGNIYYYVVDSKLTWDYTGLAFHNGAWHYIQDSMMLNGYYGLVLHEGVWYYAEDSVITWTYTGLAEHNGVWFYVEGSTVNWDYTGLCLHDGNYYYIENGCVDWSFTGLYQHNYTWYVIQGGQLIWGYDGLVLYNDLWFYAENSVITFTFTGLAEYEGILFYFEGSCLNWSYNGKAEYNGVEYDVVNGMAFF